MKICLYVAFSALIPARETLLDKLNNLVIADEKHRMYKAQSIDHILQSLKKAGVDGFELRVSNIISGNDIKEIKNIVKEHNMSILSVHQSNNNVFNIALSEIQRLCDIANNFPAGIITLHSDAIGNKLFDKEFIQELKNLQEKHGIKFGIENMPKSPFSIFKTYTYNTNEFSSVVNNAGLSMTLDTTHLAQTKGDICEFYKKNKEKIVNIHISDYKRHWLNKKLLLANGTHLSLNEGELPIDKLLKTLKEENYQGLITMEINADLNKLCQSAEIIKNALK